jgi:DNA repair protein RecO (recombination protein O)
MYKTIQGIVLKRTRFSDSSAWVSVLTETGVERFSAKGILSPRNKNSSAAAPFALSEFVILCKGDSATLSSASLIRALIRQGVDLDGLALANYISTLAHEVSFAEEDAPAIYRLLGTALTLINSHEASLPTVKAVFELKLMAYLGFYPELDTCERCGKAFISGVFLPHDGTVLCKDCEPLSDRVSVPLSESMHDGLQRLLTLPDKAAFGIRFSDPKSERLFSRLTEEFSASHLDCAITALRYYKNNTEQGIK